MSLWKTKYRSLMQNAKTREEKDQIWSRYKHEQMQKERMPATPQSTPQKFRQLTHEEMYENPIHKIKRGITGMFIEPKADYEKRKQYEYEEKMAYQDAYHHEKLKAMRKKATKDAYKHAGVGSLFEKLGKSGFINESGREARNMLANAAHAQFGGGWEGPQYGVGRKGKRKRGSGEVYIGGGDVFYS